MSIDARLNFVIKDRKKTPWGKSLGFTSPSITAMFNGHTPGPEFLNAIRRAENVNLNWLLTGEGQPYIVNSSIDEHHLAELVDTMLTDENWTVYVCDLSSLAVLVFTQPGQYEFKGKWIDYQMLEVHCGPGSEKLAAVLRQHQSSRQIFIAKLHEDAVWNIAMGQTGTYELLHSDNALLKHHHQAKESELQFLADRTSSEPVDLSLMRAVITLVNDCADELGESLNAEQMSRVITAVYRQADRLGLTSEDLTPESIRTAIDVVRD